MKNKIELKKTIIKSTFATILVLIIFGLFQYYQYRAYTTSFNDKICSIIEKVTKDYPNISRNDLMDIINSENNADLNLLKEYGIDLNKDSIVLKNETYFKHFFMGSLLIVLIFSVILQIIFLKYNSNKDKKLTEITKYIEHMNNKNYKLDLDDNTEDELSMLKNEVYKTTIMLKEAAENSVKDKINLKDSLSDISHQLKTPLASITIMLDDILESQDMDENTRIDFIKNIKRQILNINFLINSLLKLSKLDTNTIKFINKEELLSNIICKSVENISMLLELKNVRVNICKYNEPKVHCDAKWQIEAITNILKNAVEHSKENSVIDVFIEDNSMYSKIKIKDCGMGIDKEDLPHIFERFYKGKNSSNESIGIGLALSKTIIEKNNGSVEVDSKLGEGTEFSIRYFK